MDTVSRRQVHPGKTVLHLLALCEREVTHNRGDQEEGYAASEKTQEKVSKHIDLI
jgi:hypothetical protein